MEALVWLILLGGCLNGSDTDDTDSEEDDSPVVFDHKEELPTTWEANLSSIAETGETWQDKGELLQTIAANRGYIEYPDGTTVQLIETYQASCPDDLVDDCSTTDSETLGIGPSALVATQSSMKIRNQGNRGTCVAFS
ncbi:MAG: hypothetical protein HN348_29455, partial [Proteobacteria bacterium]|nr:hypothetical protein [Pseudomonadota bacterium]